jgi:hypothetical protein
MTGSTYRVTITSRRLEIRVKRHQDHLRAPRRTPDVWGFTLSRDRSSRRSPRRSLLTRVSHAEAMAGRRRRDFDAPQQAFVRRVGLPTAIVRPAEPQPNPSRKPEVTGSRPPAEPPSRTRDLARACGGRRERGAVQQAGLLRRRSAVHSDVDGRAYAGWPSSLLPHRERAARGPSWRAAPRRSGRSRPGR